MSQPTKTFRTPNLQKNRSLVKPPSPFILQAHQMPLKYGTQDRQTKYHKWKQNLKPLLLQSLDLNGLYINFLETIKLTSQNSESVNPPKNP